MSGIAVVGMSCRYADARDPRELWQTVLAKRRAFRRIPDQRLRLDDYGSPDRSRVDRTYVTEAAVITNFELDRARFHVSAQNYRSADPTHWLALDCAAAALDDAGWPEGRGLDPSRVGVLVGNSLTGDYSRAASLRLRWPYVRRVLGAALKEHDLPIDVARAILVRAGEHYQAPFPEVDGETLAGWLSNTIAGRVCNHFGFQGGGYVVDGACASSLLAISTACTALTANDLDVAIAGGVDLSLDPFELVGFARAGALATGDMHVYDRRSAGFWPGEGCGFVVLMRDDDAQRLRRRVYAVIRGWGVSSDGQGGLTRPEAGGQMLALQRAYQRAGYEIDSVTYFEGHGTGTSVGDEVELTVLTRARAAKSASRPAYVGSVKANIGHTKAAAGVAGFIKAAMAVHRQVLPPITGCEQPRGELRGAEGQLSILPQATPWPVDAPLRASVSAMGFGGINTHVTLENDAPTCVRLDRDERACVRSEQDAELIAVSGHSARELESALNELRDRAASLSRAELTDLAIMLQRRQDHGVHRAAFVARDPAELRVLLEGGAEGVRAEVPLFDPTGDVFVGQPRGVAPAIAFMFPGQASPQNADGGRWARRFARVAALYRRAESSFPEHDTRAAQPAIARAALAGLLVLRRLGIDAQAVAGHSLGELVALYWGGAIGECELLRVVDQRADAVARLAGTGSMASLAANGERVQALLVHSKAKIAAFNSPLHTVIAGSTEEVHRLVTEARRSGIDGDVLRVSHPFHHPELIAPAARHFREALAGRTFSPVAPGVYSTVTAAPLPSDVPLADHLARHLIEPVRFAETAAELARDKDFMIEVGPGTVLTRLMAACGHHAVFSLDAGGASLRGLMRVAGAGWVRGAPVRLEALAHGRFSRPFDVQAPAFLTNPCEQGVNGDVVDRLADVGPTTGSAVEPVRSSEATAGDPMSVALKLVAARSELPLTAIRPEHRLLADLHFNSITVAQIVVDLAAQLNLPPPISPTAFASASIEEVVCALTTPAATERATANQPVAGVASWVRRFRPTWCPTPLRAQPPSLVPGKWQVCADDQHPLRSALEHEVSVRGGHGTIVCLATVPTGEDWRRLLSASQSAIQTSRPGAFVIVHDGGLGSGFGASLAQEASHLVVVTVQVPFDVRDAGRWILDEALAAQRTTYASITRDGVRSTACVELYGAGGSSFPVGRDDVFIVTGGAKGVTAECGLALAARTGAALALVGRADASVDEEVQATLRRMNGAGLRVRYERADVCDPDALAAAVRRIEAQMGPVTGVIHGAAVNDPTLIADIDEALLQQTLAPKLAGAAHLAAALDMTRLRLFVAFGSIIARTGMRGEAHYALANEALAAWAERLAVSHPQCRCLTIEWSVWEGTGMGARLGRLAALERDGIAPLSIDEGVYAFVDLVCGSSMAGAVVVSGRFGKALELLGPPLPLARFTSKPHIFYPGLEVVGDAEVSADVDRYLSDHVIDGNHVFPGVMGLEAMVEGAAALTGAQAGQPVRLHGVQFDEPIIVPASGHRAVRVAACARDQTDVDVALRCDATGFAVNHFTVRCRFADEPLQYESPRPIDPSKCADASDLYDELLFQRGRFKRVAHYEALEANRCVARILPALGQPYFAGYHAATLWLGDTGVRDSAMHAVQACVPMRRLVPTHVDRLTVAGDISAGCRVEAVERWEDGEDYVYDLTMWDDRGRVIERWDELHLRDIGPVTFTRGLPVLLLQPWLTREWRRVAGHRAEIRLARVDLDAAGAGLSTIQTLNASFERRDDGRPISRVPGVFASATHDGGTTVAVLADTPVGCDLQQIAARTGREWERLLGSPDAAVAKHLSRAAGESLDNAATRIWAARESARKCGLRADAPLLLAGCEPPVVRFRSDPQLITTVWVRADERHAIFAVALPPGAAS